MNFAKPAAGEPALLSLDDARTLFHEFGHALHGMLSDVTYPSLSGTSVSRDFVELPSQLFEHWLTVPEILETHARHYRSGEPIPKALLDKVLAARTFDAGFGAVEFTASALVDMAWHTPGDKGDPAEFEAETLARLGMPDAIVMRHASPHFLHVFAGDGYSAGYYSYMWSEVLDADAFAAFEEAGNPFDPEIAEKLRSHIYSAGASRDPAELYQGVSRPHARRLGNAGKARTGVMVADSDRSGRAGQASIGLFRRPVPGQRLLRPLDNGLDCVGEMDFGDVVIATREPDADAPR
jgi:peptidyl-dipeptidase Dcp